MAVLADPTEAIAGVFQSTEEIQLLRKLDSRRHANALRRKSPGSAIDDRAPGVHRATKTPAEVLAKMAVFDLSAKVRASALQVLANRPRGEYRQVLLDGLRYPWAPAANHAAEALVVLEDTDALSALKELAKLPDPSAPVYDPEQKKHFVREVVRINHLANCMLCHAAVEVGDRPGSRPHSVARRGPTASGPVLRGPGRHLRPGRHYLSPSRISR